MLISPRKRGYFVQKGNTWLPFTIITNNDITYCPVTSLVIETHTFRLWTLLLNHWCLLPRTVIPIAIPVHFETKRPARVR
jgi:hypothetical protein